VVYQGAVAPTDHVPSFFVVSLFTKRQKEREETTARARGEPGGYLVREAPQEFRFQLWIALERAASGGQFEIERGWSRSQVLGRVHLNLIEEYGRGRLSRNRDSIGQEKDLEQFVLRDASTEQLMDVVDAVPAAVEGTFGGTGVTYVKITEFRDTISHRLREHKLSFDIVEGVVVEKDAEELHHKVVSPALTLLHGRPRFALAEKQYQDALNEATSGNWAKAVTAAYAAVEIALREILDMPDGYGTALLDQGRRRGLFGERDHQWVQRFVDGLKALPDLRNQRGDAHGRDADRAAAWLAVHWAGALVVYLVERAEALGM
jgi:hypothetical protein